MAIDGYVHENGHHVSSNGSYPLPLKKRKEKRVSIGKIMIIFERESCNFVENTLIIDFILHNCSVFYSRITDEILLVFQDVE